MVSDIENGSITYKAGHKKNTTTSVTAIADSGYVFSGWLGAGSGTDNPLSISMDSNKSIGAIFSKDTVDSDGDGFIFDELVTHSTDQMIPVIQLILASQNRSRRTQL